MGRILNNNQKTTVVMHPEEVLYRTVQIHNAANGELIEGAGIIADVIAMVAWKLLARHLPDGIKDTKYKYRFVEVVDGEFHIQFFKDLPVIPGMPERA